MIFITQLIYLNDGQEEVFEEFESVAIPLISTYNGKLLLRLRPSSDDVVECDGEPPYEVHIVQFPSETDFQNFGKDELRKQFLHLKEKSVRSVLLFKGTST
jgi:hypothetical protein